MISYKCCTEVDMNDIFGAFQIGYSDYMIKLEMTKDMFEKRFFGPEGNSIKHSFIAFDGDQPIGVILGGMKIYEGIKTMRCGAFCVHPDYRGLEISKNLFDMHKQHAIKNQCKQLFLEVIVGNDRAIRFYEKMGYEKIYNLSYYSHNEPMILKGNSLDSIEFIKEDSSILKAIRPQIQDIHINWQNDYDYIEKSEGYVFYGIYNENNLIGSLIIHKVGIISFLWIHPEFRNRGVAKSIIAYAVKELEPQKLNIFFPNNSKLVNFLNKMKFTKGAISQYEMYMTL